MRQGWNALRPRGNESLLASSRCCSLFAPSVVAHRFSSSITTTEPTPGRKTRSTRPKIARIQGDRPNSTGFLRKSQPQDHRTPLHEAAFHGWIPILEAFLDAGESVNCKSEKYLETPLHCACRGGNLEVVDLLVRRGGEVNLKNSERWTPLHIAADFGNAELCDKLVRLGADRLARTTYKQRPCDIAKSRGWNALGDRLNPGDSGDPQVTGCDGDEEDEPQSHGEHHVHSEKSALHEAVERGDLLTVQQLLLEPQVDIDERAPDGMTALDLATTLGNLRLVKILLQAGATPFEVDSSGKCTSLTPLHLAVLKFQQPLVKYLLDTELVDVNQPAGLEQRTPIEMAAEKAELSLLRLLLDRGADPFVLDAGGRCAIHAAAKARTGSIPRLKLLVPDEASRKKMVAMKGFSPVHSAASTGDVEALTYLLELGLGVDVVTPDYNKTALYIAASSGALDCVRVLLSHGADPNILNKDGWNALHACCRRPNNTVGEQEVVVALLEVADVTTLTREDWNILQIAAHDSTVELLSLLLGYPKVRAMLDAKNTGGWTTLHVCANRSDSAKARCVLEAGGDPHAVTSDAWTMLHLAAQNGGAEVVRLFLEHKVDPNKMNSGHWAPLHISTQKGDEASTRALLEFGANPDTQNDGGWSPLHVAAHCGFLEICSLLVDDFGACLNKAQNNKWTPLHMAVDRGFLSVVEYLLSRGADVTALADGNRMPLHLAAFRGFTEIAERLLDAQGDLGVQLDVEGWSALHHAASKGSPEMIQLLLSRGFDVDCLSRNERTPLGLAVRKGHLPSVQVLVGAGANLRPGTIDWYPIHNAIELGRIDITRLLLERDPTQVVLGSVLQDKKPLHIASSLAEIEIVDLLLDYGSPIDVCEYHHWTPLHFAAQMGRTQVVQQLLLRGASPGATNDGGWTPLHIAVGKGDRGLVEALLASQHPDLHSALRQQTLAQMTVWDLAMSRGYNDIGATLKAAGGTSGHPHGHVRVCHAARKKKNPKLGRTFTPSEGPSPVTMRSMFQRILAVFDVTEDSVQVQRPNHRITAKWKVADWFHICFGTSEGLLHSKHQQLWRVKNWSRVGRDAVRSTRHELMAFEPKLLGGLGRKVAGGVGMQHKAATLSFDEIKQGAPIPAEATVIAVPGHDSSNVCRDGMVGKCAHRDECRRIHPPEGWLPLPLSCCREGGVGECKKRVCFKYHGLVEELDHAADTLQGTLYSPTRTEEARERNTISSRAGETRLHLFAAEKSFTQWLALLEADVFPRLRDRVTELDGRLDFHLHEEAKGSEGQTHSGHITWHCLWSESEVVTGATVQGGSVGVVLKKLVQAAEAECDRQKMALETENERLDKLL